MIIWGHSLGTAISPHLVADLCQVAPLYLSTFVTFVDPLVKNCCYNRNAGVNLFIARANNLQIQPGGRELEYGPSHHQIEAEVILGRKSSDLGLD